VHETEADVENLQPLLDRSFDRAGLSEFLRQSGGTPSTEEEGVVFVRVGPTALYAFAHAPDRL